MPRSSLKPILTQYAETHRVILGVNADNPEMLWGFAQAIKMHSIPLFVQVTPETLETWGQHVMTAVMTEVLDPLPTPVAWHLDHATQPDDIAWALEQGFTSVMYDGSALPLEDNIRNTQKVVEWASVRGALVEAEIGHVHKPGEPPEWAQLTTPEEARIFAEATHVDALAVAIGNHHATRVSQSQVDIERLAAIHALCPVPLVLHGASGIDPALYTRLRMSGIAKMNFGTEFRTIWWQVVHDMPEGKPRSVQAEISRRIAEAIRHKWDQLSYCRPSS
jgi:fructose-bisphosphate aldolase class II